MILDKLIDKTKLSALLPVDRLTLALAAAKRDNALLEAQNARLEFECMVQRLAVNYGLAEGDGVDHETGALSRAANQSAPPQEPANGVDSPVLA